MVVGHHPLAHRRAQERQLRALEKGPHLVLGARPGHALADKNERPLGQLEQVQCRLDILLGCHRARRVGGPLDLDEFALLALAGDDVVGQVEIGGARPAVDRLPRRHLDIVGNALDALDAVRELAERRCDQHLALFLEGPHAVAISLRGAADQDHRPAILLRIGEPGEAVHDPRAGDDDAGAGAARQIAVGLRGIGGGLLVAHADIGHTFFLRGRGDRADRKPDDPEQVIDPLLLEAPRDHRGAVDLSHVSLRLVRPRPTAARAAAGLGGRMGLRRGDYAFMARRETHLSGRTRSNRQ